MVVIVVCLSPNSLGTPGLGGGSGRSLTSAVRGGAYKCGQHLEGGGGVGVSAQALVHLPSEPQRHVNQVLIRQPQVAQIFVPPKKDGEEEKTIMFLRSHVFYSSTARH